MRSAKTARTVPSAFTRATQLTIVALVAVTMGLLVRLVSPSVALLLVPGVAALAGEGLSDRYVLFGLSVAILAQAPILRRPLTWLGVWLLLSVLNLLFIPTTGVAFLVASLPFVALEVRVALTKRAIRPGDVVALLVGLAAVALCLPMLGGLARFVIEQGSRNDAAWGQPMFPALPALQSWHFGLLMLMRAGGWWVGVPIAVALALAARRGAARWGLAAGSSIVLLLMVLTPYAFGRVGPWGLSRSGMVTLVVAGLLIPLVLFRARELTGGLGVLLARIGAAFTAVALGFTLMVFTPGLQPMTIWPRAACGRCRAGAARPRCRHGLAGDEPADPRRGLAGTAGPGRLP